MRTIPRWTNADRNKDNSKVVHPWTPIRTLEEVAQLLKIDRTTVRSYEMSAFAKLRDRLSKFAQEHAR